MPLQLLGSAVDGRTRTRALRDFTVITTNRDIRKLHMDGSCFHQGPHNRRAKLGLLVLGGSGLHGWLKSGKPSEVINILTRGSGAFLKNFSHINVISPQQRTGGPLSINTKEVITPPGWSVSPAVITGGSLKTWILNIREE